MDGTVIFTPLYGVHNTGPVSYLLQLRDFTFLLDCGWGDPYEATSLEPLLNVSSSIDAGALPYLIGRGNLTAPIYATGAAHKMGQMFLYDAFLTRHAVADFTAFDLDDVDAAFSRVTKLRYRQEVALSGKGAGISITPLPAGRTVGGALWRIAAFGNECVYAVDFNHRRERHLMGASLESMFLRPALLIADVATVGRAPSDRDREEKNLLDACMATLRGDGNVLIPVDAAGRVLELLLVLERHWAEHKLTYPLAMVGAMAHTTLEFARSSLEWMNESLVRSFGHSRDNPFALRFLKPCASLGELKKLPLGPKVVLATDSSLAAGPARHLFAEWAADPRNLILMALQPEDGSFASEVATAAAGRDAFPPGGLLQPPLLTFSLGKRVPLKGEELQAHLAADAERRRLEAEAAETAAGTGAEAEAQARSIEPSTTGPHYEIKATRTNTTAIGHLAHDIAGRVTEAAETEATMLPMMLDAPVEDALGSAAATCLVEGFEVPENAVAPMFPEEDEWEAVKYDEYGAIAEVTGEEGEGGIVGGRLGKALASEAAAERGGGRSDAILQGNGDGFGNGVGGGGEAGAGMDLEGDVETAVVAAAAAVPTKVEARQVQIPLNARVLRVDFDGRSDGRSVQTILAHIAAQNTLLVHGTEASTTAVMRKLQHELEDLQASVCAPGPGEHIELAMGASFEIELSDALVETATLHGVSGYELAWVQGAVGASKDQGVVGFEGQNGGARGSTDDGAMNEGSAVLSLQPRGGDAIATASAAGGESGDGVNGKEGTYGGIFIGDVRLSELKKALAARGIASDFHRGALYCAGQVVVRRRGEGSGGLVLEGSVGEGYYKVREVIYGQYHVA